MLDRKKGEVIIAKAIVSYASDPAVCRNPIRWLTGLQEIPVKYPHEYAVECCDMIYDGITELTVTQTTELSKE